MSNTTITATQLPGLAQLSLISQQYISDRAGTLRQARASDPVFYLETMGCWVYTRYTDVREALMDFETYSNKTLAAANEIIDGFVADGHCPPIAGHVSRGAIWRTPRPGTRAQPDEPTCSSNRHRCQCRVPRRRERRPRHIAGVVSRVPCSFRNVQAFGTDRNT